MECMYLELHLDVSLLLHHKQCYYNLKTLPLHLLNSTSLSIAAIYLKQHIFLIFLTTNSTVIVF